MGDSSLRAMVARELTITLALTLDMLEQGLLKTVSALTFCFRRRHSKHEMGCALASVGQLMMAVGTDRCERTAGTINAKVDQGDVLSHSGWNTVSFW